MDTEDPIFLLITDAFSHFVVTNPAPHFSSKYALKTLLYHRITKFGPSEYLVTDRGIDNNIQAMAHPCFLFKISHSPLSTVHLIFTHISGDYGLFW